MGGGYGPLRRGKKATGTDIKKRRFLKLFLDPDNQETFCRAGPAAKAAGFQAKSDDYYRVIGSRLLNALRPQLNRWLEKQGLDDTSLAILHYKLLHAKQTKVFHDKGEVVYSDPLDDNQTQLKALDMAYKVRGGYAAEKHEVTGKDGGPVQTETVLDRFFANLADQQEKEADEG